MSEVTPAHLSVGDRPEATDAKQGSSPRYVRAERRQPMPGERGSISTCLREPLESGNWCQTACCARPRLSGSWKMN